MRIIKPVVDWLSAWMLARLAQPTGRYAPFVAPPLDIWRATLKPGDVVLIEGNTRLSAIIKFLTQSTWSHAALYIGDTLGADPAGGEPKVLLEAEAGPGVSAVPLSKYARFNTRICRPVGLTDEERRQVIAFAVARIGTHYDSRRIVDLARYMFPYPPVPVSWRRRMLAIGSGDPTKAICSALIAEAFASIRYPVLPERIELGGKIYGVGPYVEEELEHVRKSGLYTPRDFDVSPYFKVIKPTIEAGFDHHKLKWSHEAEPAFAEQGAASGAIPAQADKS